MPELNVLTLSGNNITGPFGQVLVGSPMLSVLELASTAVNETLNDTWPPFEGRPLDVVDLSSNPHLTGTLPLGERGQNLGRGQAASLSHAWQAAREDR
jgi:hypothetical protein